MTTVEGRALMTERAETMIAAILAQDSPPPNGHRKHQTPSDGHHPWEPAAAGSRHTAIVAAAGFCQRRGYELSHALLAVQDWNRSNTPPEDVGEVEKQVRDIYARYERPDCLGTTSRQYIRLSERWTEEPIPRPWLIPGFLPAGQRVALVAKWGLGKSMLAMEASLSTAQGLAFLAQTVPRDVGPVVMLDGEGGEFRACERHNNLRRGRSMGKYVPNAGEPDIFWCEAAGLSLSSGPIIDSLRDELIALSPKLIIFDTMAKVMGLSDENSNANAAQVTQALYALNRDLKATILLLSHPSKGDAGADNVRGAGELSADVDVMWSITGKSVGVRKVRCTKDRDGDLCGTEFGYNIVDMGNGLAVIPAELPVEASDTSSPGPVDRAILDLVSKEPTMARKAVATMLEMQGVAKRSSIYNHLSALEAGGEIAYDGESWRVGG